MKIWRLAADVNRYSNFTSQPKLTLEQIQSFDGSPKADKWIPLELQCIDEGTLPIGDALGFDMGFLVSQNAKSVLDELSAGTIEFLPLYYESSEYYIANVLGVTDCLDRQKAKCLYSRSNKERVLMVNKYAFDEKKIGDRCIFRLKDEPLRGLFVTEKAVSKIRSSHLTGFCFDLIWDSSATDEMKTSCDGVILREY